MKTPTASSATSSQREQISLLSQMPRSPRSNVCSTPDLENPSASVHPKRFSTPSLTLKFLCAGKLNPRNFKMTPSAEIEPPTIEIVHEQTPEPVVPLTIFMENMMRSVVMVGEEMMAFLASYHVMPGWEEKVSVCYFAEGQRRHPHVRYYFAMNMNGQIVP